MIKIAHEAPISILQQVQKITDYDYALVHLFETHPEYFEYFYNARHYGNREIILDNSLFELQVAFDPEKYAEWINKLQPNWYILPDVLEDSHQTITGYFDFCEKYGHNLPGRKIGSVQGKTYNEIVQCYKTMAENADMIAISFDLSYYLGTGLGYTKLERQASGRQKLIKTLIQDGIWCHDKPHHLLGCALAREIGSYCNGPHNIRSVDTSNPVVAGLHGLRYNGQFGIETKPSQKLVDQIDANVKDSALDLIQYNILEFRSGAHKPEKYNYR